MRGPRKKSERDERCKEGHCIMVHDSMTGKWGEVRDVEEMWNRVNVFSVCMDGVRKDVKI